MRKIVVFEHVTLDGVMQAPGRPDEDRRDGFEHGGWATLWDPVIAGVAEASMASRPALLLGRRTYEDFYGFWPQQTDNPFTDVLNESRKYVASRTLEEPLSWQNSTLLAGEAADAVAALKNESGGDLVVLGSGELVQTLVRHGLVDEYVLLIHPLVLGSGRRLFSDIAGRTALRLVNAEASPSGVVITTYRTGAEGNDGEARSGE
jgi:dihydrofolate reductase